jgi:ATP phosphoribosyltransferase
VIYLIQTTYSPREEALHCSTSVASHGSRQQVGPPRCRASQPQNLPWTSHLHYAVTDAKSSPVSKAVFFLPYQRVSRIIFFQSSFLCSFTIEGRLNAATLNLLEGADVQFRRENRLDIALVKNLPIALIFLPAADIPTFVGEGRCDLGITGWDQVQEHDASVRAYNHLRRSSVDMSSTDDKVAGSDMVMELGFGSCKLQVQVPEKGQYKTPEDLIGKTIGTSFVNLAADYFLKLEQGENTQGELSPRKMRTKIVELSGSVEAACALGVAEGIVDLVGMWILKLISPTVADHD